VLNIIITELAEEDIQDIVFFILTESYEKYADLFIEKTYSTFELLAHNPTAGVERQLQDEGVRLFPIDKVNIIYRVKEDTLQILRVHHSAMDSSRLKF
jgi:toxin ParE1/3/4